MPTPYPPDPSSATPTAAAAAAAASMNAGSIIGSPLKTADGVTFVTLGRLAPNMATHNDKPTLEIQPHTQPAMAPKSSMPGTSSSQQTSMADPTFTPQPTHTLSVRRKPNGNGGWTVPPRILLVDDDSVYRDLSGKLLQVIGCTIDLAKDGVEAIKKMGLEKYDLILMDIVMPNLDGISATRNIRQYDLLTPIISMTSNFTDNDIMQYVGSGMTDILPKPFSKRTLYSMLEKYCAHLKVIQQFQEPNVVHRGLGTIMPSDGYIEEITSTSEVAASSASTSASVMPVIASSSTAAASSSSSSSSLSYPSTSYSTSVSPVPTTTPFLSQWSQQPQQQPQGISIMPSDDGNKFMWAVPSQAEQDGGNGKKRRIE
ncbi:CheY-like superfamily [Syncephalastrum racemosum]|uniref:CheY-like superfamily n=1 Tax=Syncephalastrum racemosum TaxID=13706 RepID=A0A1X2HG38_SYNRA|nr:CheY-like superfamily [Syncephalastrum racemosum]